MKGIKNNKAFTLIEILAVVVILGIISTVAIVGVSALIKKAKENHYKTQNENVILAAQSYFDNNTNDMPKNIGQSKTISLKVLQDKNYIKDVKDYSKNACSDTKSYVKIFKYSKKDYSYVVYLDCPKYKSDKEASAMQGPTITINPKDATSSIEIKAEDSDKILSYSYIVSKYIGTSPIEVINSGTKDVLNAPAPEINESKTKIDKDVSVAENSPGKFKIDVTATDIYGNISTKSVTKYINDTIQPTCGTVEGASTTWAKGTRTIRVYCEDAESGCEKNYYEKTFEGNVEKGTIIIKDKSDSGNPKSCEVDVYLDNTAPTCEIKTEGTKGENGWYKSDVALSLTAKDTGGSGVKDYDLITSKTATYNQVKNEVQSDTTGTIWYGHVKDVAGNEGTCDIKKLKVDTKAPTKPTVILKKWSNNSTEPTTSNYSSLSNYAENAWSTKNVYTIPSGSTDATSGIDHYEVTTTGETENVSNKSVSYRNIKAEGTSGIKYRACDKAGNCSSYTAEQTVKVDKTDPTCSLSVSGTKGSNNWYTSNPAITLTKSDKVSGVSSYGMGTSSTATYNSTGAATQNSDTTGITWYGYVKDGAGNTVSCNSGSIKVDKTAPTTPTVTLKKWSSNSTAPTTSNFSGLTTYTANSWSNRYVQTRPSGSSDATSGLADYQVKATGATTAAENDPVTYRNVKAEGTSYISYRACDNAGNCSPYTSSSTIKIDVTNPTCSVSKSGITGENGWYKSNVSLSLTKNDTGGSGVSSYGMGTSSTASYNATSNNAQTADTTGTTWYGYVKDGAGNATTCNSGSIKKDSTAPTIPIVTLKKWSSNSTEPTTSNYSNLSNYTASSWSNKNIYTIASSSTDSTSGLDRYEVTTTGATDNVSNHETKYRNIKAEGTSSIKYRACDKAGNCSNYSTNQSVKIDKTDPTCSVSKSGTTGQNGWYKSNVSLSLTKNDSGGSGLSSYGMGTSSTASYNSTTSNTQSSDTSGTTWYGYVKDGAGNTATCNSGSIKKDTTAPTVPTVTLKKWSSNSTEPTSSTFSGLTSYTSNSWSNKYIQTRPSGSSDSTSGLDHYEVTTTGVTENVSNKEVTYRNVKAEGISYVSYRACDKAGNCSSHSSNYTIKVDVADPTCSISKSGTEGSNGWYKSNVSLTMTTSTDTTSYGFTTSSSPSYSSTSKSATQSTATTGTTWYGYVKDQAGNVGTCNSGSIKIDKTAPTCSVSASGTTGSNGWYKSNVTLSLTKSDSGGSGLSSYGLVASSTANYNSKTTGTQSSDTSGTTWYGYVKDAAGNTATCNSGSIKKDTVAPSVPTITLKKWASNDDADEPTSSTFNSLTTYTADTWSNKNIQARPGSSTDATSGVDHYEVTTSGTTKEYTDAKSSSKNIAANGVSYVKYRACDKAGNCSSYTSNKTIKIDKKAPTVPSVTMKKWSDNSTEPTTKSAFDKLSASYTAGTWSNKKIQARPSGSTDAHSGLDHYEVTATGATADETNAEVEYKNVGGKGESKIKFRACDKVGNCSSYTDAITVKVDMVKPTITVTMKKAGKTTASGSLADVKSKYNGNSNYSSGSAYDGGTIVVWADASDSISDIDKTVCSVTGAEASRNSSDFSGWRNFVYDGKSTVKCYTKDNAGNKSDTVTKEINNTHTHVFGDYITHKEAAFKNYRIDYYDWDTGGANKYWVSQSCSCSYKHQYNSSKKGALIQCIHCGKTAKQVKQKDGIWWCPVDAEARGFSVFGD